VSAATSLVTVNLTPTSLVTMARTPGLSNAHAQRPGGEQREPPVRWSVMLGSTKSLYNLVSP